MLNRFHNVLSDNEHRAYCGRCGDYWGKGGLTIDLHVCTLGAKYGQTTVKGVVRHTGRCETASGALGVWHSLCVPR